MHLVLNNQNDCSVEFAKFSVLTQFAKQLVQLAHAGHKVGVDRRAHKLE